MLKGKITKFYVEIDDFYKIFEKKLENMNQLRLEDQIKRRNRKENISDSEMMCILLLFHTGNFTNFKHFYLNFICVHCQDLFPNLISYERFVK